MNDTAALANITARVADWDMDRLLDALMVEARQREQFGDNAIVEILRAEIKSRMA